jgi:hypothetical protein
MATTPGTTTLTVAKTRAASKARALDDGGSSGGSDGGDDDDGSSSSSSSSSSQSRRAEALKVTEESLKRKRATKDSSAPRAKRPRKGGDPPPKKSATAAAPPATVAHMSNVHKLAGRKGQVVGVAPPPTTTFTGKSHSLARPKKKKKGKPITAPDPAATKEGGAREALLATVLASVREHHGLPLTAFLEPRARIHPALTDAHLDVLFPPDPTAGAPTKAAAAAAAAADRQTAVRAVVGATVNVYVHGVAAGVTGDDVPLRLEDGGAPAARLVHFGRHPDVTIELGTKAQVRLLGVVMGVLRTPDRRRLAGELASLRRAAAAATTTTATKMKKPYQKVCADCGYAARNKHDAYAHKRTAHGGDAPRHPCAVEGCGRTYDTVGHLAQHVKRKHAP